MGFPRGGNEHSGHMTCPVCQGRFPVGITHCPTDGNILVPTQIPDTQIPDTQIPDTQLQDQAVSPTLPHGNPEAMAIFGTSGERVHARSASSAARPDPLVGQVVAGRFAIRRKIGEGGMGAVYEAQHTLIGKRVALKILLDKYAQKETVIARLKQEARLASAIGHPNIVDITDFGRTEDGRTFVVMEYLEGESLASLLAREGPLSPERALRIAKQVADALAAAHEKGIIHRDIKPENIFLTQRNGEEFVKVVDFGISRHVQPHDEESSVRLTQTGMVLGTPLYMSPEQARGESDLDHRIDIYALGVILYEMVTNEVPFRGSNYLGIISQVLTQEVIPPRQLRPDLAISEAFERVIMKAMARNREERYQSMADLREDLGRLQSGDQNILAAPLEGISSKERKDAQRNTQSSAGSVHVRRGMALGFATLGVTALAFLGIWVFRNSPHWDQGADTVHTSDQPEASQPISSHTLSSRDTAPLTSLTEGKRADTSDTPSSEALGQQDFPSPSGFRTSPGTGDLSQPGVSHGSKSTGAAMPPSSRSGLMKTQLPGAPSTVRLRIETRPPGAMVRVNGVKRGTAPLELAVPRSDISLKLKASLPGFEDATLRHVPQSDAAVVLALRERRSMRAHKSAPLDAHGKAPAASAVPMGPIDETAPSPYAFPPPPKKDRR